jgi:hypothetical protein
MEVVREIAEVPVWGENNPRPGSLVPLLWRNVGQPKEDVVLNTVIIATPEVNETDVGMRTTTSLGGGFPYWALGIIFVVGAAVLFIYFKGKKSPKIV